MDKEAQTRTTAADCEETRRLALEFLDGELDEPVMVAIRLHIEICKPCGRRLTFEAAFIRTIGRGRRSDPLPTSLEGRCAEHFKVWRKGDA